MTTDAGRDDTVVRRLGGVCGGRESPGLYHRANHPQVAMLGLGGVGLLPWPGSVRWALCLPVGAVFPIGPASVQWVFYKKHLQVGRRRVHEGLQNRMPLTQSSRDSKVSKITGWTVTASESAGNPRIASAILDFQTYDRVATAERLQRNERGLQPQLFERPVLKFGATLVQLPWVVGMQNHTTAAINNLRRLGARRGQAPDEARRIESGLSRLLEKRGFKTLLNRVPPRGPDDAGEVDLIAVLDGHLFVIEVKSTFVRRSQRDAWLYARTTPRKAGHPLRRKVEAVSVAIASDPGFHTTLGLARDLIPTQQHLWIADTCNECDHQRFGGFLVSASRTPPKAQGAGTSSGFRRVGRRASMSSSDRAAGSSVKR